MKLSGTMHLHNGVEHDYCFEEAIYSMLQICQEVVVVQAGSTDETPHRLAEIAAQHPELKVIETEWKPSTLNQATDEDWLRDLMEIGREAITGNMHIHVQADEVLHEEDYPKILSAAHTKGSFYLDRLNFWVDPWHLVPPGRVCGNVVCRLAPKSHKASWGNEALECRGAKKIDARIFHYGFIRDGVAFRKKSEIMGQNFTGTIDPIIYEAEKHGTQALRHAWPESELLNYNGSHPQVAKNWLGRHGFDV